MKYIELNLLPVFQDVVHLPLQGIEPLLQVDRLLGVHLRHTWFTVVLQSQVAKNPDDVLQFLLQGVEPLLHPLLFLPLLLHPNNASDADEPKQSIDKSSGEESSDKESTKQFEGKLVLVRVHHERELGWILFTSNDK